MEFHQLKRIIEAALLASTQPLTLPQMSTLFDALDMPSHDDMAKALAELQNDCAERGVELVEVASGFRYQVRQDVHAYVSRLWNERQSRYSRALLETLALIAYRQPITRAEIEQIRGVAVSTNMVRTLEEREWIRVVGYRDLPGKPALFGTTRQFLDYFNLKSLDELPALGEIRELEDVNAELALGSGDAIPAQIDAGPSSLHADAASDESTGEADLPCADEPDSTDPSSAQADDATEPSSSPRDEPIAGAAQIDIPESA